MKTLSTGLLFLLAIVIAPVSNSGVATLVTHGYNSDSSGWLSNLASAIEDYPRLQYLNGIQSATVYKLSFDAQGYPRASKMWEPPGGFLNSKSGDVVIVLDWNPYSGTLFGTDGVSTKIVGPVVADALLSPTLFEGLGFSPSQLPLHLIGHSRGGSLVCEISKRLGERNVVVDHLTLLDPHPLNNDGFDDIPSPVDGTARYGVYDNVLFCDSYYQTEGTLFTPNGTFVNGAYVRYLGSSSISLGGYNSPHSNAHLWYHGTVQVLFPLTSDGEASINMQTRQRWYASYEDQGMRAGYYYSMRGGGNRRENFNPIDRYNGRPIDGLNEGWANNLGISNGGARAPLVRGNDIRGNIIEFRLKNLIEEQIASGGSLYTYGGPVTVVYTNQFSGDLQGNLVYTFNGAGNATLDIFIDSDENRMNGNRKTRSYSIPPTGNAPRTTRFSINSVLDGIPPGRYRVGASIDSPMGKRQYYAPEVLLITPQLSMQWTVSIVQGEPAFNFLIRGLRASRYALERSEDLTRWERVASGTLTDPGAGEWVGLAVWNGISMPGRPTGYFRSVYLPQ